MSSNVPHLPPPKGKAHPPLTATSSSPISPQHQPQPNPVDPRGSSLGRNVVPPTTGLPSPNIRRPLGSFSVGRPPSNVSEEHSEVGSDTDTPGAGVSPTEQRHLMGAMAPLSPPIPAMAPAPGSRLSPWKEITKPKGHARSMSHGGVTFIRTGSNRERHITDGPMPGCPPPAPEATRPPLQSALKKPGHRRVFSHGQINPELTAIPNHMKGQVKTGSKTDFILPPDHVERERKSSTMSVHRAGSSKGNSLPGQGRPGNHKRGHSRGDSLGQFFRGHSRQASRTDSIYTLRQTTTNYKNKIFWWQTKADQPPVERKHRVVVPNHLVPTNPKDQDHPNSQYLSNRIRTTKYTFLSFIPRNLFEQFHRFANLYFLFIVLLNWVPAINAFGKEISMIPVILVLFVTALKDLFEDRRRYASDKKVNNSSCRVYSNAEGKFEKKFWKDLRVGDIVHLSNNEQIPADILLLHSSDENGLCYIDTQNLDGETNLKQREFPRGLKLAVDGKFNPKDLRANLECDAPTTKIYRFHGSLVQPWGERVPVGKDNLLLRECLVKNTDFIEGLVVYAGHESKAMLNNGGPRYKRSKLERQMNLEVVWCVVILIALCLVGAFGQGIWLNSFSFNSPFLCILDFAKLEPLWNGFLGFWTFIIILQIIIPLSLYVTIELTKLSQVYLIHNDPLMYDHVHEKRVECRALNIPEELGQVEYMFCDKTGTLTENKMVFKRCTIAGQDYNHNSFSQKNSDRAIIPVNPKLAEHVNAMDIQLLIEGKDAKNKLSPMAICMQEFFLLLAVCNTVIVAKKEHRDTMNASGVICSTPGTANSTLTRPSRNANTTLSTILGSPSPPAPPSRSETPSPPPSIVSTVSSTAGLTNSSSSATPLANNPPRRPRFLDFLPAGTRPLSPIHSSAETTPCESPSTRQKSLNLSNFLHPLNKLSSFTSSSSLSKSSRAITPTPGEIRPIYEAESPDELALVDAAYAYNIKLVKRTPNTVSVSMPGEGVVEYEVLHVLPFDSVRKRMSVLLKNPSTGERKLFCKGADSNMLPRLIRPQNAEEEKLIEATQEHLSNYAKYGLRVLMAAVRTLGEEEYKDWLDDHNHAVNALEKRDKLLMDSYNRIENKMKLVGATGIEDRLQEGVPDAIARLREAGIVVWVLTGDKQETAINIAYSCRLFSTDMEVIKLNARSRDAAESALNLYLDQCKNSTMSKEKRALVVDGKTLIYILDKRANIQHLFLSLTKMCSAVLACRATPLQKAYLVRIVKEVLRMHTLAIGDGANDVSMIQTADIGVGISGQEGMQAVMASDFAITRFRFIERLLLIHGHWCYDRLSRMVLHFFYKNAAFVFVCFWFQLYCGFSGQVMIDQMYLMLFNLFFTSLPPVAVGVFDRDAPADLLSSSPDLYAVGRLSTVYKPHSFWVNMADALYQSLVVFFVAFGAFNGSDMGLWEFGTLLCSQCILVMLIQLGVETKSWTIFHWMAMLVSVVLYLGFGLTYNAVCSNCAGLTNPYWVMQHGLMDPVQYLVLIITAVLSTLPRVFMRAVTNTLQPTGVITAVRLRRQERNTKKMLDKVETKAGFVKFFRSSSSDIGNSLSSSTNAENGEVQLSDTEMTNM